MSNHNGLLRLKSLREKNEATAEQMARDRSRFDALRDRKPVASISSFNLFQTPQDIASRLAEMLEPKPGSSILEPSAGLGRLVRAVGVRGFDWTMVDSSQDCCSELYKFGSGRVICGDFLECDLGRLGGNLFDRIIMNPPFKLGRDIKHVRHALGLLAPGGRLVGLCYDGARQNKQLRPIVDTWEVLPTGSFKSEGTSASVAMFSITVRANQDMPRCVL